MLVMNFFIPSGSAKAFLLVPLIVPVAEEFDIPAQLTSPILLSGLAIGYT